MNYKTKIAALSGAAALLALIYAGSFVFDPDRVNARDDAYAWLDAKSVPQVDGVALKGAEGDFSLKKKNGVWVAAVDGEEYPAKQSRVEDLLGFLSKKGAYPVRGKSADSLERFGLSGEGKGRIILRGGETVFLDLLIGNSDATGGVNVRKNGSNEARSGADSIARYVSSSKTSWYNLRLFPESEKITLDAVQRVIIVPPVTAAGLFQPNISLTRVSDGWTVDDAPADTPKVESYLRSVLDAEGEDFAPSAAPSNKASLTLELGNGTKRVITVGEPLESNKRRAVLSSSPYTYTLAGWAVDRLFKGADAFKK